MLRLLVEELQPRPSQFDHEEGCLEWVTQYSAVAPVVLHILSDSESMLAPPTGPEGEAREGEEEVVTVVTTLPYGEKCRQQLLVVRWVWLTTF